MADVPVVMAVALNYVEGHRTIGIAFADTARRQLGACEFTDDEHFCNLELAVVQLGARECMLAKVSPITTSFWAQQYVSSCMAVMRHDADSSRFVPAIKKLAKWGCKQRDEGGEELVNLVVLLMAARAVLKGNWIQRLNAAAWAAAAALLQQCSQYLLPALQYPLYHLSASAGSTGTLHTFNWLMNHELHLLNKTAIHIWHLDLYLFLF